MKRRRLMGAVAIVISIATTLVVTATGNASAYGDGVVTACQGLPFTDRGYLTAHPEYGANNQVTPCTAKTYQSVGVPLALLPAIPSLHIPATGINVSVLHAITDVKITESVASTSANASVASVAVSIPGLVIQAHGLYSQASSTLSGGLCDNAITTGQSDIANLTINGKQIPIAANGFKLVLGIVNIYVGQTVRVGGLVTQRALVINIGGNPINDIVFAQAVAGVACTIAPD